jgi:hypothetical protein
MRKTPAGQPPTTSGSRGRRFDPEHPAVRGAAQRAGMDVETYLLLKATEGRWAGYRRSRVRSTDFARGWL